MTRKRHPKRGWTPELWASPVPFGLGERKPNNYYEFWRALLENRDRLPYAWRILSEGVCDGCALGTSGLADWTLPGPHLCNIRLRLLRLNTMPALDARLLADVEPLEAKQGAELRELGRLPYPMLRRRGEKGFGRIGWDEAMALMAERVKSTSPDRLGFYLTSRGMTNETYYAAQKAVRALGTNAIDNAARVCHSPSTVALKEMLGISASSCSYSDWLASDLVVFVGSNVATNQPVATKYLHYAKKSGAKVVVINTYREPGMERYWIPSVLESALFGTKLADRFFIVNAGGDIGLLNGALKHMISCGWIDERFIQDHTSGFASVKAALEEQPWEDLESVSGLPRAEMAELARLLAEAGRAVFVWSMGVTQHEGGEETVRALVNLALSRGFIGREGCGVMPIRGHSGVQGGAEMGAYATAFPGGVPVNEASAAHFKKRWGFEVPSVKGLTAPEMIDAAHRDDLDVLLSVGGNFLEVLPDPPYVREALARVPLRVHLDIVLSSQMLITPAECALLLPATTRYEIPGGVTETTTERRIVFSPEIPGPRLPEARPEWEVFRELAERVRPELDLGLKSTPAIRAEIARVVPFYAGIERLAKAGDQVQYGGAHLCADGIFPTEDGKARFAAVSPPRERLPEGMFLVSTRRGKQFNSMVHETRDAITGAGREAVLMNREDAARLDLEDGDAVILRSDTGSFRGRVYLAPVKPGNLQVHWPEGNVLIPRERRSPQAGIPDYNALVSVEKVEAAGR
jgi:molybdopterin-dependent oxidoreductase alpha subunit